MAKKVKLRAVLQATLEYEVDEDYDGCESISELCRHEMSCMKADPTDMVDHDNAKIIVKVVQVKA